MPEYNKLTPELIQELAAVVGEENCHFGEAISDDYSHDEMPIYGTQMPEVVCFPSNTEEVSAIMKICNENIIPVTVRGAGTGLVGGSTPLEGGLVLCTMHMNQILSYDMNNLTVRIQPGVRLCDLAADALAHGLMYPPDPGEKTGSVGGNVSTNAGGMRAVKYGTTRDYVLAMTTVLPNGEILDLGRSVTKSSSGYSLLHLMIGSEGTLGVITELTMKLIPNPQEDISFILPFEDIEKAISAVPKIKLAGLDPQSIEFMERDIVDSSAEYTGNKVIPTVVNGKKCTARCPNSSLISSVTKHQRIICSKLITNFSQRFCALKNFIFIVAIKRNQNIRSSFFTINNSSWCWNGTCGWKHSS